MHHGSRSIVIAAFAVLSLSTAQAWPQQLSPVDVQVIAKVHHANQMEIKAGQLAAQQAQGERVRRYGDLLGRDHRNGDQKVQELAHEHGLENIPQPSPDTPAEKEQAEKQQQMMQKLQSADPAAFDREFTAAMIQAHQQAIKMLEEARGKVTAGDLRDLLQDLVPILRQHLDIAQELNAASTSTRR